MGSITHKIGWELTTFVVVSLAATLGYFLDMSFLIKAALVLSMILMPLVVLSVVVRIVARVIQPFLFSRFHAARSGGAGS